MWLTQGLTPSYKTIANFRKNNPTALQTIFKEFSILLKDIKLITGELIGIDGAFLRENASKNTLIMKKTVQNYTPVIEYPLLIILLIIEVDNFRCVAILT